MELRQLIIILIILIVLIEMRQLCLPEEYVKKYKHSGRYKNKRFL